MVVANPAAPRSVVLNTRFVFSIGFCGWGRNGLEAMCTMLDLPSPLTIQEYIAHAQCIHRALTKMDDGQQIQAGRNLKIMLGGEP